LFCHPERGRLQLPPESKALRPTSPYINGVPYAVLSTYCMLAGA